MTLRLLPEADGEAISAALWYEDQRSGLGDEFLIELESGFAAVEANPESLPLLEGYSGSFSIRRQKYVMVMDVTVWEFFVPSPSEWDNEAESTRLMKVAVTIESNLT
jgi:hypothetical protein